MRTHKKLFIFIILIIILFCIQYSDKIFNHNISLGSYSGYDVIKLDKNKNYSGIGQKKVYNKDGYFTTFTTEENCKKTYKEYKQNGNAYWSDNAYWGGTMAKNGCGITAMAIILSGYGFDVTPEDLRQKYYPVMDYDNFSSELSETFGIENSDFYYDPEHLSNEYIIEHLESNRPIIVCVWNNFANNRWTTASHYMVLLATDGDNMVYVSNPNGLENDSKSSGWYNVNEVTPYLVNAIYIEDYT